MSGKRLLFWPWLMTSALLICPPMLHAQERQCDITIGSCHRMPLSDEGNGILDKIVREAFRRIDKQACIVALPCERSLMNADSGEIDGDILRIPGMIAQSYPRLRSVPELLYPFSMSAFTLDKNVKAERLEELAPLRVGYLIGWKILEDRVRAGEILRVRGAKELFALLAEDRADIVIYERLTGLRSAAELGLKDIQALDPPLIQTQQYLVLNERHAKLLEPLAMAIRAMKKDGSYNHAFRAAGAAVPTVK